MVDTRLNETGKKQSQAFYARFGHLPFKKIYTSTLYRTVETVQNFLEKGIPLEQLDALNEISYGELDGIGASRGNESEYRSLVEQWDQGMTDKSMPGGESPKSVKQRQQPVIEILKTRPDEDLVLISMHGRAMRILLSSLLNLPLTEMKNFSHSNLCLYTLNYDGEVFQLEKRNDISHLELIMSEDEKKEIV